MSETLEETIEKVIDDLEKLKNDPIGVVGDLFDKGFDCGLNAAQERLREVLTTESNPESGQHASES